MPMVAFNWNRQDRRVSAAFVQLASDEGACGSLSGDVPQREFLEKACAE